MSKILSDTTPPHSLGGTKNKTSVDGSNEKRQFVALALNMSWQLAVVVLVPVVIGVQLDKHAAGDSYMWTFIGLGIALLVSAAVMWRMLQRANKLPVQKLTDAQKRAVKKSYEEDDADV
jgi:F0F1-type ATP synthase assembly protein I